MKTDHKIMVVDSDPTWSQLITDYLRACGFRVVSVRTAVMILQRVIEESPSLLLLDLMHPRREGLKVCRELSQNHAAQHIPIIMVTPEVHTSDRIVALELGVDDYMNKPFNLHELSLRIERSLERAAARREFQSLVE